MRFIEMQNNLGAPLTDAEITRLEEQLGFALAPDYVAFLRQHNGGRPKQAVFPIKGFAPSAEGVLSFFFGAKPGHDFNLASQVDYMGDRVPAELLPIACDVFGNLICLAVSGANKGKVYWWWHEEEADEGEPPTYDNIYFVADSFDSFLNILMELPK